MKWNTSPELFGEIKLHSPQSSFYWNYCILRSICHKVLSRLIKITLTLRSMFTSFHFSHLCAHHKRRQLRKMTQDVHLDSYLPSLSTANPIVPWPLGSMTIITTDQETIILDHCSHVISELRIFAFEIFSLQLSLDPA